MLTSSVDGVVVLRTACGHVAPVLNDILAIDTLATFTEVMIVHHTGMCAGLHETSTKLTNSCGQTAAPPTTKTQGCGRS